MIKKDWRVQICISRMFATSYCSSCKDVGANGNCGYRDIASTLGMGEHDQPQVWQDLLWELYTYCVEYDMLFQDNLLVDELFHSLNFLDNPTLIDRWITMPHMGHIVVSKYNVVVHILIQRCLTFQRLRLMLLSIPIRKIILIGVVNNNHFKKAMS